MSRHARAVDANHAQVVRALRQLAVPVVSLAPLGNGAPDVLIWSRHLHRWRLVELKDGTKPPSARKLTEAERAFFTTFASAAAAGDLVVCLSVDEVLKVAGVR